ncbi:nucleotidyl transferase AbiEii/AbiGii toxin family protein [Candidatus Peregrinibacteria bacterium]|nr:nucleotidyl transferase AbiEii/AbiGii toxin family protein [Candidatus Peregrinibacteria bacterium]
MISQNTLQSLAKKYQTSEFPNVIREYFQHLFLSNLYKLEGSEKLLFKGGTALRIIYGSPRFSEDLDFSIVDLRQSQYIKFIEDIFTKTLSEIELMGVSVKLGAKPGPTKEGYYADASFRIYDYPLTIVSINISGRNKSAATEIDLIPNDFVTAYNIYHLSQKELVEEKVFGALLSRKKPRDFYDLYFIMRKGVLDPEQKHRLKEKSGFIKSAAEEIDFKKELSVFLPADQQMIVKNFKANFIRELNNQ